MAVAFDAASESERTGTTDPHTWTHTPTGTPRGVILAIVKGVATTDFVTSATYGGVALSEVVQATDAATEPGNAQLWFLGSGIPTGAQTVSVDLTSGTGDDIHFVCMTVTAAADTFVIDSDKVEGDTANPSVTLQVGGRTSMAFAALYGGGAAPTSFTQNANCTSVHDVDLGNFYSEVIRQTSASTSDFAIGGTSSNDDVAYVALSVTEKADKTVTLDGIRGTGTASPATPDGVDISIGPSKATSTAAGSLPTITAEDGEEAVDATVTAIAAEANAVPDTPEGVDVSVGPQAASSEAGTTPPTLELALTATADAEASVVAPDVTVEEDGTDATVSYLAAEAAAECLAPLPDISIAVVFAELTTEFTGPSQAITVPLFAAEATARGNRPDQYGPPQEQTEAPLRTLLGVGA